MKNKLNNRILIIDDETVIRDGFRMILSPKKNKNMELEDIAAQLFDSPQMLHKKNRATINFEITEASNGQDGFKEVQRSIENNNPFALAYIDIRMPGWNGLETANKIRAIDEKIEIIFLTAYSDFTIEEMRLKGGENIGYFSKPFTPDEILQATIKSLHDWNRLRDLELLINIISKINLPVEDRNTLLKNIFEQLIDFINATQGLLLFIEPNKNIQEVISIGTDSLENFLKNESLNKEDLISQSDQKNYEIRNSNRILEIRFLEFDLLIKKEDNLEINSSKIYLLKIFLEHATKLMENVDLKNEVKKKAKLSLLGEAMSQVIHDLRTPLNVIKFACDSILEDPSQTNAITMCEIMNIGMSDYIIYLQEILDINKEQKIVYSIINLSNLFDKLRKKYQLLNHSNLIDINFSVPDNLELKGDFFKVERVIQNIVNNGIEALKENHVISPKIIIKASLFNSFIKLEIEDNGPGIPNNIKDHIFEPFVSHGKKSGTGLGLSISHQIVLAHKGFIKLMPKEVGAGFEILFPIAQ